MITENLAKKNIFISKSTQETQLAARDFCACLRGGDIVTLSGDLGSGKTTFVQTLLETLGARGPFVSPTFLIMKEYPLDTGSPGEVRGITYVYHIDAYRITSQDMIELGWSDIVQRSDALIVVEWPQMIASLIPEDTESLKQISLEHIDENSRSIQIA